MRKDNILTNKRVLYSAGVYNDAVVLPYDMTTLFQMSRRRRSAS
jgi:hypothetical protein